MCKLANKDGFFFFFGPLDVTNSAPGCFPAVSEAALTSENMCSFLAKSTTRVMAGVMILVNSLKASRSTLSPSDVGATGDWPILSGCAGRKFFVKRVTCGKFLHGHFTHFHPPPRPPFPPQPSPSFQLPSNHPPQCPPPAPHLPFSCWSLARAFGEKSVASALARSQNSPCGMLGETFGKVE